MMNKYIKHFNLWYLLYLCLFSWFWISQSYAVHLINPITIMEMKYQDVSPIRLWANKFVTAAVFGCSCCWYWGWCCGWQWGWYRGWYCGLYCGWGWGLASPWDSVEEAEEEVEEPWTVRLIQESGLCRFGLTRGRGATTDDCLRTDASSSEPDEESEKGTAKIWIIQLWVLLT